MTVEVCTVEGALCGIGSGIQPALDIGCDGFVVTGVGAVVADVLFDADF